MRCHDFLCLFCVYFVVIFECLRVFGGASGPPMIFRFHASGSFFFLLSSDCLLVCCCYFEDLRYLAVTLLCHGGSRIFGVCFAIICEILFLFVFRVSCDHWWGITISRCYFEEGGLNE